MTDKVQKIKDWISNEQDGLMDAQGNFEYPEHEVAYHILCNLDTYIDSLQKEPVSEGLKETALEYANKQLREAGVTDKNCPRELAVAQASLMVSGFKAGAKWQKENLWKPADGDDLPEIDKEVIALLDNGKVGFAHRPPEYWDGKNIVTGKVTRYYPKTYGKGGWNIPDIKFWLDV